MYGNGLANTFANIEVSGPTTKRRQQQDKVFIGNKKKNKRKMYEDTDYNALERNVKYIPWKGLERKER